MQYSATYYQSNDRSLGHWQLTEFRTHFEIFTQIGWTACDRLCKYVKVTKILHQKVVDLFTCKLSFTALDLDLDKHLGRAHWYTVHLPTSYLWQSYYLPEKTSKNNFLAVALRSARMPRHWPNRVRISTRLFKFRWSSQNATIELKSSAQFEWPFVDLIFTLK